MYAAGDGDIGAGEGVGGAGRGLVMWRRRKVAFPAGDHFEP